MDNEAIEKAPWLLEYVPVHFRMYEMCERAVEKYLHPLDIYSRPSYHLKTQEVCEKAAEEKPYQLGDFSDHFKTQKMCERAVENEPETPKYIPDRFKIRDM